MIEIICGDKNEGKTPLALNRVINDYKINGKDVVYFSDKSEIKEFRHILEWYYINPCETVTAKVYFPITFFKVDSINNIFDVICDMRACNCGPDVICIDCHVKAKEFKEIERMERIFYDSLFIVTVDTQTFYDAIHKIEEKE